MARRLPDDLKRYEVEVPTRNGGGVKTTLKLTDADARRRGLLESEPDDASGAKSKKRAAPKPAGRGRAQADTPPAGDDD